MDPAPPPVRIALINDYEIVVNGLHRLLKDDPRLQIVELDCLAEPEQQVDVALFDTFAPARPLLRDAKRLLSNPRVGRLVVFTWDVQPGPAEAALDAGISGYVSKALGGPELANVLLRVAQGEVVIAPASTTGKTADPGNRNADEAHDWPGRDAGLTTREAEVLGLITQGKTNADIALQLYLSINSVKTYIRSAYRKIGAERRSQAVLWGTQHGMAPRLVVKRIDPVRRATSALRAAPVPH